MKAIVLRQPWASLVLAGRKTIELRTWSTRHRGPLLVIAGKGIDHADARRYALSDQPRGVSLCVVELLDVRPANAADREAACCEPSPGEWAWLLAAPRAVARVPVLGRLGLYDVEIASDDLRLG